MSMTSCDRLSVRKPSSRARRSTSSNRSGWRGAMTSSARGLARAHPLERPQHHQLFAAHRRTGDDDRPLLGHAEEAFARGASPRSAPGAAAARSESYFRLPVTVTLAGSAPRSIRRAAETVDCTQNRSTSCEHAAEQRPDQPVARVGAVRDASVGDGRPDAAPAAGPQQVGPDLRFHHHEQAWAHQAQRAVDDEAGSRTGSRRWRRQPRSPGPPPAALPRWSWTRRAAGPG